MKQRGKSPVRFLSNFAVIAIFFSLVLPAHAVHQETPISVTGELTVLYVDDFDNKTHKVVYKVKDKHTNKTYELRFHGNAPAHLETGAVVTVRGKAKGHQLILEADGEGQVETVLPAVPAISGEQRTIVMVASFLDEPISCSVFDIEDLMFTDVNDHSVDDLYQETSLGQTWFSGDVVGTYTINFTSTGTCDYSGWAQAMDAAAIADGVNLSQFNRKVYVLPRNNPCQWAGLGTLGGNPSRSWIVRCSMADVYAHELGHNLGMHHSSTLTGEYGDVSDIMGYAGYGLRQINAPHMEQMGWRSPEQFLTVTQGGLYDIAPLELDVQSALSHQILKISKQDTGEYYYLSYRQPLGFDANVPSRYLDRLNVHRYRGGTSRTYFLDALLDGESFVDPINGVTVQQVGHSEEYVTVMVEFDSNPVCIPDAPAVSLTPASRSGEQGTTVNYTVSVINQDSGDCGQSTFSLNPTVPAGWSGTISPNTLTLQAGQSGSASLFVTSSASSPDGSYTVSVQVSDSQESVHTASSSATYVVVAADTQSPTAPTGLAASVKRKQVNLSWNPATDNVGVAGYTIWRDGAVIGSTTATGYNDRYAPKGVTCTYWVTANDAAGNVSNESNHVSANTTGGNPVKGGGGKGRNK